MVFGLIAAVIAVAASAGVYYQQRKMEAQAKRQAQEAKAVQISGHDSNRGLYTVYGKAMIGSTTVWKKVSDKQTRMTQTGFTTFSRGTGAFINGTLDLKSNRFLYRAVSLCAGPIASVENVLIDDEGYQSSRFGKGDNRHFAASVSLGPTAGQNFSAMRTSYADFNAWGSTFTGKGVAYAIERLYLDNDKPAYQGEPSTKYLVKGRLLYDPRKDSTSSVYDSSLGTSTHRSDTPSTWQWSDNPVLALLDYMTNTEYGRGLDISVIDLASIADSADKCDELVDIPARLTNDTGSTYEYYDPESGEVITVEVNDRRPNHRPEQGTGSQQKRFRINIAIDPTKELLDNIQEILNVFRGNLSYANGKYRVHMADVASPVLTIDDDDIVSGLKISNGDRTQRMNRATVKFINANKQHKTDQVSWPSLDSNEDDGLYATYLAEDQDEKLHKTFTIKGCTDYYQAQDTAEFLVRDSRSNLTVSGTFGSRCFGLVPGDVISLTYDSAGYSGKYFRVMQVGIDLNTLNVNLQLKEYDSSVYSWNDDRGTEPEGLSWQEEVVNETPTTPVIGTLSSATRTRADGSTALTLTIPFSNIPEQAQYVDVEWGINGTDQYNSQVVFDTENINQVEVPIERDNATYAVRVRYFIADSAGTLMASTFATDTITVGNLTGTKLGGIEEGATANNIYQQAAEPTGGTYNDGDIWIDTDDGYRMYLRSGGAWVDRADTRIATAITDAAGAQATADGKVVTFFQDAEPADASSSTGDLWIDTNDSNKLYRYNGTDWESVRDSGIASAISSAATAQSTADGKIVTFYQDDEPAAASSSTGDLWFDTNDNNKLYRYNGTDWVSARDAGIATALSNAATAQSTADGKIVTFYQDGEPAAASSSEGDLWIDTNDNNKLYRFNGTAWQAARDSGIASAISDAATAQATADGKVTTFYAASSSTPTPEGTGDLWYQTDTALFFRYNGSTWQEVASYNTGDLADLDTVDTDQIEDNAVDITKIADTLQSTNYSAGSAGWKLTTDGTFEAGNGTFRGALTATSLTLDGTSIAEGQLAQGVQDSLGLADSALQIGDIAEIISAGNIPTGQLTFNDSGSKTVSYDGNNISVTGGNDNSWDTQVYSSEHYASPCVLQFETTFNSSLRFMMGLNEDPTTNASYSSIDYSWYLNTSTATIYENGGQAAPDGGSFSYSVGDKFSIVYDGDNVYYYHNDTLKRTVTGVGAKDFYLDSSLYDTPLTINDVRFAPISRIDYGSLGGVTITPGKLYQGTGTHNHTNTGFYLDSSGKFSLKDKLSFDGTTLSVDGNVTVDEFVKAGSGSTAAVMSGRSADNFAFWAGADFDANGGASGANAPFRVTRAGKVIMTNFALYSTTGQKLFDSTDGLLGLPSTQVAASTGSLVSSVSDELTSGTDYATIQLSSTQTITVDFDYPLNYLFASGSSEANAYGQIATSITVTIQKSTDASTWSTFGSVTFNKTDSSSASSSQYYVQKQTVYLGSEFGGGTLYFASLQPGGAVDDGNVLNGNVSASLATGTHYLRMQVTYGGSGLAAGGIPSTTAARSITLTTSGAGFTVDSSGNVSDGVSTSATTGWVLSNFVEKTESDNVTINGTLTLGGDLVVNGTTTTINSTTLEIDDKNITLASGAANATAAQGAGITIDGANRTFTYTAGDKFETNTGLWAYGNDQSASNYALVGRDSAGNNLLLVRNDGIVQVPSGYFFASNSAGAYFTGAIRARGGISNDQGDLLLNDNVNVNGTLTIDHSTFGEGLVLERQDTTNSSSIKFTNTAGTAGILYGRHSDNELVWRDGTTTNNFMLWHQGNDGPNSGLDADTVDGLDASSLLRSDASDDFSGSFLEFQDNSVLRFGTGADFRIWHEGSNQDTYFRNYRENSNVYFQSEDSGGTNHAMIYLRGDTTAPYVQLYYDGGEVMRTSSGGITITNNISSSGINTSSTQVVLGGSSFTNMSNAVSVAIGSAWMSSSASLFVNGFSRYNGNLYISDGGATNYVGIGYSNGKITATGGNGSGVLDAFDAPDGYYVGNVNVITSARAASFATLASGSTVLTDTYTGGTGDFTNISTPQLKIAAEGTTYWRIPHVSGHSTVSGVYNYQTGKDVYWGEDADTGVYLFRGRDLRVAHGKLIMGAQTALEVASSYLRINQSSYHSNGVWFGSSDVGSSSGTFHWGSNGAPTTARVIIEPGTYDGNNVIKLDGADGHVTGRKLEAVNSTTANELMLLHATSDRFADAIFADNGGSIRLRQDFGQLQVYTGGAANSTNASGAAVKFEVTASGINIPAGNLQIAGTNVLTSGRAALNLQRVSLDAASGNGYNFWDGNGAYVIYMSQQSDSTYGGRVSGETSSDYNIYFKMQSGTNRGFVFRDNTNNYFSINPGAVHSEVPLKIGSGNITLDNSTDRSGLLDIQNAGQGWTGVQFTRSAGDHWSVMGNDGSFGLYDDQNGKWILLHNQNGATTFYHNGNEQCFTQSNGLHLNQFLVATQTSSNRDSGYYGDYSPTRLAHIWSMDTSYKIAADGNSASNIYGLTYSYNPDYQGTGNNPGAVSGLGHQMQWRSNGTTHTAIGTGVYTIGNVTAYSDRRVKTNIQRIPDALNKVCKLNGYTYERTDLAFDEATGEKKVVRQAGVIAQEVLEVLPEVVTGSEEHHYGVAYGNMVSLLIEAIKELKDEVDSLKSQLKEKDNGDH